ETGRVYAAEMRDYPEDPPAGKPPRGRIRLLEDTDGDGRIDRATVFADHLLEVTSMLPWKGGLIVCAAPEILYLKDTDGDGKADVRKTLFTGFALVNPESRITNLRFAVDNWIYASNNGQPGKIRYLEHPEAPPVDVIGADFRFRLDRGLFEAESGPTQFGQAMDDWGHRFVTENTVHARNVVLPRRYLARNPFLPAGEAAQDISDHGRPSARMFPLTHPQQWREARTRMRQQRYRENNLESVRPLNPSTEIVGGYFTGAAGGTIYCGDTFPEKYRGNLFTGDVSGNLVHRDLLRPNGVTFTASRPAEEAEREFLASTDPWFRPCNFATGPDGNLYVVDMYREFIETPESIPESLKKDMDFYSGDTMGRIYRIVPKSAPPTRGMKYDLAKATTAELVGLLGHGNGWWRLTAQRLLLERQDRTAVPRLREQARGSSPQARLHALYALEGLDALDAGLVAAALGDTEPGVREHAVRLAESYPDLAAKLGGMISDPSAKVRLQLALSLGEFLPGSRDALSALASLASEQGGDRWFRAALLSCTPAAALPLLERMLQQGRFFTGEGGDRARFLEDLAAVVGARRDPEEIARFLRLTAAPALRAEPWQVASLSGLARGCKLAGAARLKLGPTAALVERSLASPSETVQAAARALARHLELRAFLAVARREASDRALPASRRAPAIAALAGGPFEESRAVFEQLLGAERDPELVRAAVQALGAYDEPAAADLLIAAWKSFGPEARNAALDVLLEHRARVPALVAALESGRIEKAALDLPRREKLAANPDAGIRERARKLFGAAEGDRARVVEEYRRTLRDEGDAGRGKAVFEKDCATCHMPRRGRRIGPDLSGVSSRTREQLL
ncbi:MAG: dehydrogenase, partial [Acidobacteria bacterium]